MDVQKLAKKVLDLLPFDGSKLKLGGLLSLFALLRHFVPGVDLWELVQQLLSAHLDKAAIITVLLGALHKALKAKYPAVKF